MDERPDISVIAPTRDRSPALTRLVASLARCEAADISWELVVVDNGSSDDTASVAKIATGLLGDVPVRWFVESVPGLHAARHRGAREAGSDILVFVDDDIEASEMWLRAIWRAFRDPAVEIVGGPSLPRYRAPIPAWLGPLWTQEPDGASWCGYLSLLDFGSDVRRIDPAFVWGLNFAIRRETLQRLRGFHPDALPWALRRYRGDGETGLALKAKKAGVDAWYAPDALVYHDVPAERLSKEYFLRRPFLQGISDSFTAVRAQGRPSRCRPRRNDPESGHC